MPFRTWTERAISDLRLTILPITVEHADIHMSLAMHHRDPFDRMLAAQAIGEGIPIVSNDAIFDAYGVRRIWD